MSLESYYARLPKRKIRREHIIVVYARSINWNVQDELCKLEAYESFNSRVFSADNIKRLVRMPAQPNLCKACGAIAGNMVASFEMAVAP